MVISELVFVCSAGETFDSVALIVYEDERYAADLLCANPEYSDKMVFDGGERLRLPYVVDNNYEFATAAPTVAPWRR